MNLQWAAFMNVPFISKSLFWNQGLEEPEWKQNENTEKKKSHLILYDLIYTLKSPLFFLSEYTANFVEKAVCKAWFLIKLTIGWLLTTPARYWLNYFSVIIFSKYESNGKTKVELRHFCQYRNQRQYTSRNKLLSLVS